MRVHSEVLLIPAVIAGFVWVGWWPDAQKFFLFASGYHVFLAAVTWLVARGRRRKVLDEVVLFPDPLFYNVILWVFRFAALGVFLFPLLVPMRGRSLIPGMPNAMACLLSIITFIIVQWVFKTHIQPLAPWEPPKPSDLRGPR